ncbi:hypothetical protein [Williamsia sterculiae]|nr:hypothetical protein [Williamsia sterculiae]
MAEGDEVEVVFPAVAFGEVMTCERRMVAQCVSELLGGAGLVGFQR